MKLTFWKKSDQPKEIILKDKTGVNPIIFKIIAGLIILGLIINFVLLFLLNSKIASMKEDNEIVFESINRAAMIMDKNSGTSYSKDISIDSLKNKETFQQTISLLTKQASNIVKERDALAKILSAISVSIDPANPQKESSLTDMNSYEKSSTAVSELSKKSLDVNGRLASFVADTAERLQTPLPDRNAFIASSKMSVDQTILKSISDAIGNLSEQIISLKDESAKKDTKISELTSSLKTSSVAGGSDDLKKLFNQQRKELEQIRNEYEALKIKSAQNSAEEEELEEIQTVKEASEPSAKPEIRNSYPELYYKLTGNVVEYNTKWGFVIINIGSDSKLTLDIDGTEREVTVQAPLGQEVYIARGDQFIAKAKIANVYGKYSVANVIFPTNDQIQKGDSIFFDQPTSNVQEKKN